MNKNCKSGPSHLSHVTLYNHPSVESLPLPWRENPIRMTSEECLLLLCSSPLHSSGESLHALQQKSTLLVHRTCAEVNLTGTGPSSSNHSSHILATVHWGCYVWEVLKNKHHFKDLVSHFHLSNHPTIISLFLLLLPLLSPLLPPPSFLFPLSPPPSSFCFFSRQVFIM